MRDINTGLSSFILNNTKSPYTGRMKLCGIHTNASTRMMAIATTLLRMLKNQFLISYIFLNCTEQVKHSKQVRFFCIFSAYSEKDLRSETMG